MTLHRHRSRTVYDADSVHMEIHVRFNCALWCTDATCYLNESVSHRTCHAVFDLS